MDAPLADVRGLEVASHVLVPMAGSVLTRWGAGAAFGPRGPAAGCGGSDAGAYWGRTGMQHLFTSPGADWPARLRPAFGDAAGGLAVAGAVGTALYRRIRGGEPSVIDVALLASGMWQIQPDIVNAGLGDEHDSVPPDRHEVLEAVWLTTPTAEDR